MHLEKFMCPYVGRPMGKMSSVHFHSRDCKNIRLEKAIEQAKLEPVALEKVISYIAYFLVCIGMAKISALIIYEPLREPKINYKEIQSKYELKEKGDLVWLKFTKDGYIGVVASGADINFKLPESKDVLRKGKDRRYNTSGIIVRSVNKEWDESFVLVFPLSNIPKDLTRHRIETGIGNYLIDKNVPILDFYSHNY